MGLLRASNSSIITTPGGSSDSGLLVFTKILTGFGGTLGTIDTGITQIFYIEVLNLVTSKAVEIELNVTGFSTVVYASNVDLANHQIIIKGV